MQTTMKPKKNVDAQTQSIRDTKKHPSKIKIYIIKKNSNNYNIINSMNNLHSCFVFKSHINESLRILYLAFTFAPLLPFVHIRPT